MTFYGCPVVIRQKRDKSTFCQNNWATVTRHNYSRRRHPRNLKVKISDFKAPSTRIRKFVKTQIFFYEYGLRPHVSSVFSGRIRKFLKTLSRVEIFLSDTNTYTCGRSYPQICEYAYVILFDPVFTASIKQTWRTARLCLLC